MSDAETQKAINETLRQVKERLGEKWEETRLQRQGDDAWDRAHWVRSERMATYNRAMKIVDEHLHRLSLKEEESDR